MFGRRSSAYFVALLVCVWAPENVHARQETRLDVLKGLLFSDGRREKTALDTPIFQYSSESTAEEELKGEEDRRVRLGDHRVLCEVVKKRMEFKISGMTHKPDSLTFYACKESNVSRHSSMMVQELIDFGSDRGDKEFCWISRERGPPKCETKHQQVAVFSREFGSSLWSYRNVHVPAGCGCHLGMKHFN